jgi:tetratricopeptide (TPR) repeat protein
MEFASTDDLMVSGLVAEGLAYAQASRFIDAEIRLRQAQALRPDNEAVRYNIAVIITQNNQAEEAEAILIDLLSRHPSNPSYAEALANVYVAEGRYEEALQRLKGVFHAYRRAGNLVKISQMARSISNIAFGIGNEADAVCYSAEAVEAYPTPAEVGAHMRILVALNLFKQADEYYKGQATLMHSAVGYHYQALARYAMNDVKGASEAEDIAYARNLEAPEKAGEISAAWWLMKNKLPPPEEETDEAKERFAEMRKEVADFAQKDNVELVTWPGSLRSELYLIVPEEE